MTDLLIRNAEVGGRLVDVALSNGRISAMASGLRARDEIDARGGALLPGLADHHIHLLATAARSASVSLDDADHSAMVALLRSADAVLPQGRWIRATGYHEALAGPLDRAGLDAIIPQRPVRVQHQTGATWTLNSAALAIVGSPPGGAADGRLMRLDRWLRERLPNDPPPLAPLGQELARMGITHVTDASVTTDANAARLLCDHVLDGSLPVKLTLMSGANIEPSRGYEIGPVKILLDDADLPSIDELVDRIRTARTLRRPVAVHCVTAGELAVTLAALETAGAKKGDRIEHGAIIPSAAIPVIRALGLTVVTQSVFVRDRGDRYLANVDPLEQQDLYRCASLLNAGIGVAGSSDAPYGALDPWRGIAAAITRKSVSGRPVASSERIGAADALRLYLGRPDDSGGASRRVAVGERADLCLLTEPMRIAMQDPRSDHVRATFVDGSPSYLID